MGASIPSDRQCTWSNLTRTPQARSLLDTLHSVQSLDEYDAAKRVSKPLHSVTSEEDIEAGAQLRKQFAQPMAQSFIEIVQHSTSSRTKQKEKQKNEKTHKKSNRSKLKASKPTKVKVMERDDSGGTTGGQPRLSISEKLMSGLQKRKAKRKANAATKAASVAPTSARTVRTSKTNSNDAARKFLPK